LRLLVEKIPFFVLAALMSVVTFVVQQRTGALAAVEHLSLGARSVNALISYCRYLGKLFWPSGLAVFYPHPREWPLEMVLLAGGLLLGLSMLVWFKRREARFLLFGWLWYCGTLAPVNQMVQTGRHAMADRYTYLPSLGMLILAVWAVCAATRRWRHQVQAISVAGGAALFICLALTRQQLEHWKSTETLFRHALAVTENNDLAHTNLGGELLARGRTEEAIPHLREAIRLSPDYAAAHVNLGLALEQKGQTAEAIRHLEEAVRLKPDYVDAHMNLGNALLRSGQIAAAIRHMQEAIRLQPDDAAAHNNLGGALCQEGRITEAIQEFQAALRLQPGQAEAHNNLGIVFYRQGRIDEAIRQFQETLRLKPDHANARRNLDAVLAGKARASQAPTSPANP
jgi:protein O-mannosyl-transferase